MKKLFSIMLKNIGALAVGIVFLSANTTSSWTLHQPELPQGIQKFKRI